MRLIKIFTLLLTLVVIQASAAAATISGFAVAARWTGTYGASTGDFGKIMKYTIVGGVTTATTVLYDGLGRFATISPDGKYVAFFKKDSTLVVMNASGGTPTTLLTDLRFNTAGKGFIDWPTGDWVWYGKCITGVGKDGFLEIWKVNWTTKQNLKVCSFNSTNQIWQFFVANDGVKAIARPLAGGVFRFTIQDSIYLVKGDANDVGTTGCGAAISSNGAALVHMADIYHVSMVFQNWDKTKIATYNLAAISTWGAPFWQVSDSTNGGMNNQRFSANDPKWIVTNCGLDDRACKMGSNQVLINFVDHQIIRTSKAQPVAITQFADAFKAENNETGDFWVGTPPVTGITPAALQKAGQATTRAYTFMTENSFERSRANASATVWDLRGRRFASGASASKAPRVYIMEKSK